MNNLMQKYKNIPVPARASFWFVICGIIQKGISFLTTPFFSRLLTTAEYGITSVFGTWNGIITIIATLNLSAGVYLRGLVKYSDDRKEFTSSLQWLFILTTSLTLVLYLVFQNLFNPIIGMETKYIVAIFIDVFVCTSYQFWASRQRVDFLYKKLVTVTLLNAFLKPLLGIIAILIFEDNVSARIYTMVLADVIAFGYFLFDSVNIKKNNISAKYWKYALQYNIPLVPHYLSGIVLNQADRVMINDLTGASDAGIYSLAYNLAAIMTIVNQSILNSYNPWMYKILSKKDYSAAKKTSFSILVLIAIVNLLLIILAPELIMILAPSSYSAAIWVIPPVAMGVYFNFVYSLFSNIEYYFEKTKFMMVASVTGAILNIVLNYICIRKFGFLAAGYTTLFCYLYFCMAHYIVMKKIMNQYLPGIEIYNIKAIILVSVVFVCVGFSFMYFYNRTMIRLIIFFMIIVCLYIKRSTIYEIIKNVRK